MKPLQAPKFTSCQATAMLLTTLKQLWPATHFHAHLERDTLDLEWAGGPWPWEVEHVARGYERLADDNGQTYQCYAWWDTRYLLSYACGNWHSAPMVTTSDPNAILVSTELDMVHLSRKLDASETVKLIDYTRKHFPWSFDEHMEVGVVDGQITLRHTSIVGRDWLAPYVNPVFGTKEHSIYV